jgi:hypothetical protein
VDEYEELNVVLAHYALAWGSKIGPITDESMAKDFRGWGLQPAQKAQEEA